jgi:hypothetical protein
MFGRHFVCNPDDSWISHLPAEDVLKRAELMVSSVFISYKWNVIYIIFAAGS